MALQRTLSRLQCAATSCLGCRELCVICITYEVCSVFLETFGLNPFFWWMCSFGLENSSLCKWEPLGAIAGRRHQQGGGLFPAVGDHYNSIPRPCRHILTNQMSLWVHSRCAMFFFFIHPSSLPYIHPPPSIPLFSALHLHLEQIKLSNSAQDLLSYICGMCFNLTIKL